MKVPSQAVLGRQVDDIPAQIRENNANVDTKKKYATVVYRVVDDKTVVTPVTIGKSDATHTIIISGISEEDKLVVGPYKVLEGIKHDQKVEDEKEKKEKEEKDKKEVEESNAEDKQRGEK